MNNTILINEQHLGGDSTADEARGMVRLLKVRGYDVEYGDKIARGDDENANAIPDDVWTDCLNDVIAGK